ncbi:hypothetical protein ACFPFV_12565 [Salinicoccus siamensis]|uniref:hypothetical protein n=1 Tax=Salinicoccus siamensis TaxID=381830 RepID=UPI0036192ADD
MDRSVVIFTIVVGLLLVLVFAKRQLKLRQPILEMRVFRNSSLPLELADRCRWSSLQWSGQIIYCLS